MNFLNTLSPVWQTFLASLFTFSMTAAGALLIFFTEKPSRNFSVVAEAGAAGIMIAASFFSLLNPAFDYPSRVPSPLAVTVGFVLGGFFVLIGGKWLSKYGHEEEGKSGLMYAAVTLHNIPEGLAVGVAFAGGAVLPAALLALGIGIQNIPEGLCVACPLRTRGMSRKKSFFLSSLSGAIEIPAALIGVCLAAWITGLMPWALSFAAGAMIAVAAAELIPESFEKNGVLALVALLAGFALMMFLDTALG